VADALRLLKLLLERLYLGLCNRQRFPQLLRCALGGIYLHAVLDALQVLGKGMEVSLKAVEAEAFVFCSVLSCPSRGPPSRTHAAYPTTTFARQPKRRLLRLSASLNREAEQQMMSTVRAVPPSES
jgi:hypothetical protein